MRKVGRMLAGFGLVAALATGDGPAYGQSTPMWSEPLPQPQHYTWQGAVQAAETWTEGGYDDWRLPTLEELEIAANDGSLSAPYGDNTFNGTSWVYTSKGQGIWVWAVLVTWENGLSVSGTSGKILKDSWVFAKFVREVDLCGNGQVDAGEDSCNCPADAGAPPVNEPDCTNGLDEDCDGATDCTDTDCATIPACQSACNGDGVCESDENCGNCPGDCDGKTNGPPSGRYCCGNGTLETAEDDGAICDGNP